MLDPEGPSDIFFFFWSDLGVENTVQFNVDNCEMLSLGKDSMHRTLCARKGEPTAPEWVTCPVNALIS